MSPLDMIIYRKIALGRYVETTKDFSSKDLNIEYIKNKKNIAFFKITKGEKDKYIAAAF